MTDRITIDGRILFEPENVTKKHADQASWKRMAMVMLDGDLAEYYARFIRKRYRVILNKPLRGAHISFINDSLNDIIKGTGKSPEEANTLWNSLKTKWDGKTIPIVLDLNPRTNDSHWWLNIPQDERQLLHDIRAEIGLGRPFWGLHMSMGYVNEKNIEHSKYIHRLLKEGLII